MTGATDIYQPVFFLTRKLFNSFLPVALLLTGEAYALSYLKIDIGSVNHNQAEVSGFSATFNKLDENDSRIELKLEKVLPRKQPGQQLEKIALICEQLQLKADSIQCDSAGFSLDGQTLSARQGNLFLHYDPLAETADLKFSGLQLLSGKLSGQLHYQPSSLKASLKLHEVNLTQENLKRLMPDMSDEYEISSRMAGKIDLLKQADSLTSNYDLAFKGLTFSNPAGDFLGDSLAIKVKAQHELKPDRHRFSSVELSLSEGEMLTPFFYSDFNQRPLSVGIGKTQVNKDYSWLIDKFTLADGVLQLSAAGLSGHSNGLQAGTIKLHDTELNGVYDFYFLPVISNDLAQLTAQGKVNAQVSIRERELADYQLNFSDISLEHLPDSGASKYLLKNLHGRLISSGASGSDSFIQYDHANLFETIDFGSARIPLITSNQSIAIAQTAALPVLDGQLMVETFTMDFSQPLTAVEFEGQLTPVSLSVVTEALGWPEMQGKISGIIPSVSYNQRNANIDGIIQVKVFDGHILVKNVLASHLLSAWPVLKADVEFIGIDLEQLTQTFEFGRITGNIDGQINRLVLENWEPTSFDASFKSSKKSKRKRISQKAVDNISNLGGAGVAGALSRTFMRFFEDFGYDQIGLSCKLSNGVCEMDGVEEANQGYYLVKGGGIPRIDVIGHNRRTDWNILVNRLIDITEAGTPDIQ